MIADRIALIGANGNMGKRYARIMDWCNIPYYSFDLHNMDQLPEKIAKCESIILATPTDGHFEMLVHLKKYNLPILCEKPITKDLDQLYKLLNSDIKLKMVNQYKYMLAEKIKDEMAESWYDYFKSGGDGIYWDCINIIGLARNFPTLSNESPIWRCRINNQDFNLSEIDYSYISMIQDWKNNPKPDHEYIALAHERVHAKMRKEGFYK